MKCPDCNTKMNLIKIMYNINVKGLIPCKPYYRCSKCGIEIDKKKETIK